MRRKKSIIPTREELGKKCNICRGTGRTAKLRGESRFESHDGRAECSKCEGEGVIMERVVLRAESEAQNENV